MDDYISKPFKANELVELIAATLGSASQEKPSNANSAYSDEPSGCMVDWNHAFDTVGGDRALLVDLIETFLGEKDRVIEEIYESIRVTDFGELKRQAHSLKGSLRHLGALTLADTAERLELLEKEDSTDTTALFSELQKGINQLTTEFRRFTNN